MSALAPERVRPAAEARPTSPRPKLHLITRATPAMRVSHAPKTPFVILLLMLLGGGLMGLLLLNTVIDQDAFTLHDLQSKQTALDVQEASLRETADNDADPAALAAKAAALGMIPAGSPHFVKADKLPKGGKRVGNLYIVMGKPTPAPVAATAPVAAAVAAVPTVKPSTTATAPTTRTTTSATGTVHSTTSTVHQTTRATTRTTQPVHTTVTTATATARP